MSWATRFRRMVATPFFLFLSALLIRAIYIFQLQSTPYFYPLTADIDDGMYQAMALRMAEGGWLEAFPMGAYRSTAYPLFMGVLFRLFGPHAGVIHTAQALIGACIPVLVYRLAYKTFENKKIAWAAGMFAVAYVPLIYFEHMLVGETLAIFFALAGLCVLAEASILPAAGGFLLGLSALFRANSVFAFAVVAGIVFLRGIGGQAAGSRRHWKAAAGLIAGFCAAVVPMGLWNQKLYGEFLPFSAHGGINFYIGNNREATGSFHAPPQMSSNLNELLEDSIAGAELKAGHPLKSSQVSAFWVRQTFSEMAADPLNVLSVLAKKAAIFSTARELPDILDIQIVSRSVPFLTAVGWAGFGTLLLSAVAGFILLGSRMRNFLAAGYAAGYAASLAVFFLSDRYRLPITPMLMIFAGAGIVEGWNALRRLDYRRLLPVLAVIVPLAFWTFRPTPPPDPREESNILGIYYARKGDYAKAETYFREVISVDPGSPGAWRNLGVLLVKSGRPAEAEEAFLEAQKRLPKPSPSA